MNSIRKVIKAIVPLGFVQYFRLLRLRIKFPNCEINSPNVSPGACIDDHVKIASNCEIGEHVTIDRYSYIEPYSTINVAKIGAFCSIGKFVSIGAWEHPLNWATTSPRILREVLGAGFLYNDTPAPAVIGNDVWIGNNAVVLGGVVVGDGAVIGAGAVVTKDVPSYGIVAGVPAKLLRFRFKEEVISEMENENWPKWTEEQMKSHKEYFTAPIA